MGLRILFGEVQDQGPLGGRNTNWTTHTFGHLALDVSREDSIHADAALA